jgi:hypothetical protein
LPYPQPRAVRDRAVGLSIQPRLLRPSIEGDFEHAIHDVAESRQDHRSRFTEISFLCRLFVNFVFFVSS